MKLFWAYQGKLCSPHQCDWRWPRALNVQTSAFLACDSALQVLRHWLSTAASLVNGFSRPTLQPCWFQCSPFLPILLMLFVSKVDVILQTRSVNWWCDQSQLREIYKILDLFSDYYSHWGRWLYLRQWYKWGV